MDKMFLKMIKYPVNYKYFWIINLYFLICYYSGGVLTTNEENLNHQKLSLEREKVTQPSISNLIYEIDVNDNNQIHFNKNIHNDERQHLKFSNSSREFNRPNSGSDSIDQQNNQRHFMSYDIDYNVVAAEKLSNQQMNRKNWDKKPNKHHRNKDRFNMKQNNRYQNYKMSNGNHLMNYKNGVTGYRNFAKSYRRGDGYINYYDTSDSPEDQRQSFIKKKHKKYRNFYHNKWPNLERLEKQIYRDHTDQHLPPYIKKYNRRNKQLLNLFEGTISPSTTIELQKFGGGIQKHQHHRDNNYYKHHHHHHHHHLHHQRHLDNWIETNLFEEQRVSKKTVKDQVANGTITTTRNPNELPDEEHHIRAYKSTIEDAHHGNSSSNYRISSKADKFTYHRIAAPKSVDVGLKRQRLPFVAITDRKLDSLKNLQPNNIQQNILPLH